MFGLYTPILALQGFCLYHAYSHNAIQKWYWLILFLPGVGCVIYLYHNFYNRGNIQSITEGVKHVVNSNYKLEQLEKAHRLSDNITSKTNLADAYVSYNRYDDAIKLYTECLAGFMADDATLNMKLLNANFLNQNYEATIACAEVLRNEKSFRNSEARVAYAWALFNMNKIIEAQSVFADMNKSFSNYVQRLAYCKFLVATKNKEMLQEVSSSILEEYEHMKGVERRFHSSIIRQVRDVAAEI